jgi:hypothetical protein
MWGEKSGPKMQEMPENESNAREQPSTTEKSGYMQHPLKFIRGVPVYRDVETGGMKIIVTDGVYFFNAAYDGPEELTIDGNALRLSES